MKFSKKLFNNVSGKVLTHQLSRVFVSRITIEVNVNNLALCHSDRKHLENQDKSPQENIHINCLFLLKKSLNSNRQLY